MTAHHQLSTVMRHVLVRLANSLLLTLLTGPALASESTAPESIPPELPAMTSDQMCTIQTRPAARSQDKSRPLVRNRVKFENGILEETMLRKKPVSSS